MPVFYKILIVGLCSLGLGIWSLVYDSRRPSKNKYGYDSNMVEFIRAIGMIVMGIIALLACLKMKF